MGRPRERRRREEGKGARGPSTTNDGIYGPETNSPTDRTRRGRRPRFLRPEQQRRRRRRPRAQRIDLTSSACRRDDIADIAVSRSECTRPERLRRTERVAYSSRTRNGVDRPTSCVVARNKNGKPEEPARARHRGNDVRVASFGFNENRHKFFFFFIRRDKRKRVDFYVSFKGARGSVYFVYLFSLGNKVDTRIADLFNRTLFE